MEPFFLPIFLSSIFLSSVPFRATAELVEPHNLDCQRRVTIPWFVCEFGLGPSACKNHPQAAPCGIKPQLRKGFRPFGVVQRAFPTRSPQRLPGFSRDSQAAVISPPSFPPPLRFPSFPLGSEKSNGTISPSPARAILPPMRDSFAPAPNSWPRALGGSPAQAPTEPARTAPTPANPTHLLEANQGKPRKTKPSVPSGADGPPTLNEPYTPTIAREVPGKMDAGTASRHRTPRRATAAGSPPDRTVAGEHPPRRRPGPVRRFRCRSPGAASLAPPGRRCIPPDRSDWTRY